MPHEPDRDELAPANEADLSGEERFDMDAEARAATQDLSAEEQAALLTVMRRHVEEGLSDREAWKRAYEEVRGHDVPVAREGEEGALRDAKPVQARKDSTYAEPDTVEANHARELDRERDRK